MQLSTNAISTCDSVPTAKCLKPTCSYVQPIRNSSMITLNPFSPPISLLSSKLNYHEDRQFEYS